MQEKLSPARIGCLGVIGLFLTMAMCGKCSEDRHLSETASTAATNPEPVVIPKFVPGSQWSYSTTDDKMGRKRSFAVVRSDNVLEFGFPYQGSQHGTLTIRKSTQWGTEVILTIERGQFLCDLDGCVVNYRFDGGAIHRTTAGEPSDHGTTTLFLQNAPGLVARMKKAKKLTIEATYYQEGAQVLEFDVEGLKWE